MTYLDFFSLKAEPFSHAPSSEFYFASPQHSEALNRLTVAARGMKGLALLVGDTGRGKSTLARRLLDSLPEDEFEAAMTVMVHAGAAPHWILRRVANQMGVADPAENSLALLTQLHARLVEIHESGKKAVMLIDEAQMLASRELMEEFRGLINLEVPGHKLLTFVFFGLPEVEQHLKLDPPLAQRVAMRCHLKALAPADTAAYVEYRLHAAGAVAKLFSDEALTEVHRFSGGVPRLINTLCDNILLDLFFAQEQSASTRHVINAAENLNFQPVSEAPPIQRATPSVASAPVAALPALVERPDTIAARVAQEPLAVPGSDAEAAVDLPGESWPGLLPMAPYLGGGVPQVAASAPPPPAAPEEHSYRPQASDVASPARAAAPLSNTDLLANVDTLLEELTRRGE